MGLVVNRSIPLFVAAGLFLVLPWLLHTLHPDLLHWLRYQREAVEQGQVWRLLTAHLLHLGWAHLTMNTAAAALLLLAWRESQIPLARWLLQSTAISIAITLGLWFGYPDVTWYVGMSGLLHGWVVLLLPMWWRTTRGFATTVGAGLAGKLVIEQSKVSLGTAAIGADVIHQAHWLGALAALLVLAVGVAHRDSSGRG